MLTHGHYHGVVGQKGKAPLRVGAAGGDDLLGDADGLVPTLRGDPVPDLLFGPSVRFDFVCFLTDHGLLFRHHR